MMGRKLWIVGLCLVVAASAGYGQTGWRPWEISFSAMGSYDNNRDGTQNNKEDLLETHFAARAALSAIIDRTDLELYYAPAVRFRDDPRYNQNSSDIYHDAGLNVEHEFSPRGRFVIQEFFRATDDPAIMEEDWTFRESVSYHMNRIKVGVIYDVIPERGVLSFRASELWKRYVEDDDYSKVGDEDSFVIGATMKYLTRSRYNMLFDLDYRDTDIATEYNGAAGAIKRGSQVVFLGAGVEKVFGRWRAKARVGADIASYDNAPESGATSPGMDFEVAFAPSDVTSFDLAIQYHTLRGDVSPYAAQQRTSIRLTGKRAVTARTQVNLQFVYGMGAYEADTVALDASGVIVDASKIDGDDGLTAVNVGLRYRMNKNLTLITGFGYQDWDSDPWLRESHTRFTGNIGVSSEF